MATIRGAHTWFWVDASSWVPLSPRVDAGPVWAQATITPVQLVITLNDGSGTVHTCDGPGTPLPEGVPMSEPSPTCSVKFTIATSGVPWPVSVHAVYSVSWSGFDGTSTVGGTLPDLVSAPVAYPMLVLAAKPALIDPNTPTD